MLAGYGLGGGILVCALTTRYRDFRHVLTFGTQLLMYLTPVIYPISAVPASYRWMAEINPWRRLSKRCAWPSWESAQSPGCNSASFAVMILFLAGE